MAQQMAAAQDAVVLNMGNPNGLDANKEKTSDTLFGPNIGIVSGGPEWTERHEKSSDELTPEIIKSWIARSKEVRVLAVRYGACPLTASAGLPDDDDAAGARQS